MEEIIYSDGINEDEAKALANDYIKKHKDRLCRGVYIFDTKNDEPHWKVQLSCDASAANTSPGIGVDHFPPTVFYDIGVLRVNKKDGKIIFSLN